MAGDFLSADFSLLRHFPMGENSQCRIALICAALFSEAPLIRTTFSRRRQRANLTCAQLRHLLFSVASREFRSNDPY